jgi:hypothetical protein
MLAPPPGVTDTETLPTLGSAAADADAGPTTAKAAAESAKARSRRMAEWEFKKNLGGRNFNL